MNEQMPVTGLHFERFPEAPKDPTKLLIVAATPTRIYQFIGGPTFEAVFMNYENNNITKNYYELQPNPRSELRFFSPHMGGLSKSFAWSTGPGIYVGGLRFGSQKPGDSVMVDCKNIPYPSTTNTTNSSNNNNNNNNSNNIDGPAVKPVSFVITEFHYLLMYDRKLIGNFSVK